MNYVSTGFLKRDENSIISQIRQVCNNILGLDVLKEFHPDAQKTHDKNEKATTALDYYRTNGGKTNRTAFTNIFKEAKTGYSQMMTLIGFKFGSDFDLVQKIGCPIRKSTGRKRSKEEEGVFLPIGKLKEPRVYCVVAGELKIEIDACDNALLYQIRIIAKETQQKISDQDYYTPHLENTLKGFSTGMYEVSIMAIGGGENNISPFTPFEIVYVK